MVGHVVAVSSVAVGVQNLASFEHEELLPGNAKGGGCHSQAAGSRRRVLEAVRSSVGEWPAVLLGRWKHHRESWSSV